MKSINRLFGLFIAAALILQTGCSTPLTSLPQAGRIKLSIKGALTPAPNSVRKSAAAVTITSARIVIDEIEFESSLQDLFDFEFEMPFVQDLVVASSLHEIGTFPVPFGTYKELELEIDALDEKDADAFTQNPQMQNLSIRIEGFLNGVVNDAFVFTSDLSAEQETTFNPPIVIDADTPSANVVLNIDMTSWFMAADSTLIDPRIADNKIIIESNIKASINAFEDDDDDGEDNDDEIDDDDGSDDDD